MAAFIAAQEFYQSFGIVMRRRRKELNLTQHELSILIGLTRGSIANMEAGRQSVLLHQMIAIAAALNMRPEKLLPNSPQVPELAEPEMPESVLAAVQAIRRSVGKRSASR
jgi:transcriptional regulator with XRE-family HTH domain